MKIDERSSILEKIEWTKNSNNFFDPENSNNADPQAECCVNTPPPSPPPSPPCHPIYPDSDMETTKTLPPSTKC